MKTNIHRTRSALFLTLILLAASLNLNCILVHAETYKVSLKDIFRGGPKIAPPDFVPTNVQTVAIIATAAKAIDRQFLPLELGGRSGTEQAFMEAFLKGGYQLADRSKVKEVLDELKFQEGSGLTDPDTIRRAGKMLNATHLLIAHVSQYMAIGKQERVRTSDGRIRNRKYIELQVTIESRLLDIESGTPAAACSYSDTSQSENGLAGMVPFVAEVAKRVASAYPSRQARAKKK